MTSFGHEIMLTRGCWFQTLDVNKPWRQIPADRLLFLVFTHFCSDYPKAKRKGEILLKSNHVIERNFETANGRITELVQASYKKRANNVWVISQILFCLTHAIMQTHPTIPGTTAMYIPLRQKATKVYSAERNKRFDNFIMLVWVQGSPFHIAAGSHPVQEAWGHKIQGSNSKSCFSVVKNHTNRFLLL